MHSSKNKLFFVKEDFDKVKSSSASDAEKLTLISEMIRFNSLATIVYARSGHIGASLSATELFTVLYHKLMHIDPANPTKKGRDIFILSKGHAAAGQYAALASIGFFPEEKLLTFRKLGGLQGHVDVSVPGIDGNTGSLGMGISKGQGYAWAYKASKLNVNVYVMVGDGELQEGQNWEAIQSAPHLKLDNLFLIVDRNMVQTDREVSKILDVAPLEEKLRAFGWEVASVNGNNAGEVLDALSKLIGTKGKPKALIANTIKGKGISFMEHPMALKKDGFYRWHAGIPSKEEYEVAYKELSERMKKNMLFIKLRIVFPSFNYVEASSSSFYGKALKSAFSETLLELAERHLEVVVLDADLSEDCGLLPFEKKYPDRFIEVGIAEQNMVSMAGGLACAGKLPIVNTYAAFLTSRSNEQIFNNCCEGKKVIYIGHLAGILPAKPGKSHQGIRDISLLKSIPDIILCEPCNSEELKQMMKFAVENTDKSFYMRLEHTPPRNDVILPANYKFEFGKGTILADGKDVAIIAYGPLMVSETLLAAKMLEKEDIHARVINLPWLNNINKDWLTHATGGVKKVFSIDNHYSTGGQSEEIRRHLPGIEVKAIGIEGFGQSGDHEEILRYYNLNSQNIAKKVRGSI